MGSARVTLHREARIPVDELTQHFDWVVFNAIKTIIDDPEFIEKITSAGNIKEPANPITSTYLWTNSSKSTYLMRNTLKIAILPAGNQTKDDSVGELLDDAVKKHFTDQEKSNQARYKLVKIILPQDIMNDVDKQVIKLPDLFQMSDKELGRKFDVDFILRNKINRIRKKRVPQGQSLLIESSTGAVVWCHDWGISKLVDVEDDILPVGPNRPFGQVEFSLKYGFLSVLQRMPIIGRPLKGDGGDPDSFTFPVY